ncbi:MAG: NAD-dependent epimerase/dehydratase family protein [Actinobacteria bacterium]|nr:MAG: NAD-dependent epimerase/dehydratase family protein [Actinomycetota bacterium]
MRVVVIGASGNVGTSLLEALAREERVREVVGVARRVPEARFAKASWRTADIADPNTDLAGLMRGADCVVHLAWLIQPSRDESQTHAVNVEGSQRVFDAAALAGVPSLVYASSIGAYAPGPKDRAVDESWPTTGIAGSFYARHKAAVERILDSFEAVHPEMRVVRLRPGLIFKRAAATGIRRLFAGPLLPSALVRRELIPFVPRHPRLVFQAVHSLDVGEAYRLAIVRDDARGAYNVAADPVLDPDELGRILGARPVRVPASLLRLGADVSWRLHLQPTSPGWVDMALAIPVMDTTRIRTELGWSPRHTAADALLELLDGIREGAGERTPPLSPETTAPARVREVLTGVGRTSR